MKNLMTATALISMTVMATAASAEKRTPYQPSAARETKVDIENYGQRYVVERIRTRGRDYAKFAAAATPIDDGAVMVFEIHSESHKGNIPRWRCVAVDDTSECFGEAVKVRYVVGDVKMVLSVTAQPRQSKAGVALLAEARRQPTAQSIAQVWVAR